MSRDIKGGDSEKGRKGYGFQKKFDLSEKNLENSVSDEIAIRLPAGRQKCSQADHLCVQCARRPPLDLLFSDFRVT